MTAKKIFMAVISVVSILTIVVGIMITATGCGKNSTVTLKSEDGNVDTTTTDIVSDITSHSTAIATTTTKDHQETTTKEPTTTKSNNTTTTKKPTTRRYLFCRMCGF